MRDINKIFDTENYNLNFDDILLILNTDIYDEKLFLCANKIRTKFIGDAIYLRGIIEFSNYCKNTCAYCGLNKFNKNLIRYAMTKSEILSSVDIIVKSKIKTIVLQSGEYDELNADWLADIISSIKKEFGDIAVTLSVGEKSFDEYKLWRDAGADRYLLKIETTDKDLYNKLHPDMSFDNRMECLKNLQDLGYETGTGNIIGLPGQSSEIIARDLIFFRDGDFDMVSVSPFIPSKNTVLSDAHIASLDLTLKTMALARMITKDANIPSTTALGSMDNDYRMQGLNAGANVIMPNFTPHPYREKYEIYQNKRCISEQVGLCYNCLKTQVESIGRYIDDNRGDRKHIIR